MAIFYVILIITHFTNLQFLALPTILFLKIFFEVFALKTVKVFDFEEMIHKRHPV